MPPDVVGPLLAWAVARLKAVGCATPELDARLLLQAATGLSREEIMLEPRSVVRAGPFQQFQSFLARREAFEPVSRILGEREFYGRAFRVTPDTLDPRPDTETLVDAALSLMPKGARILDLGTGTGAIAITLLAERPDCTAVAVDLSPGALRVTGENAAKHRVDGRLRLLEGNWLEPVSGVFDLIASNPPYISAQDIEGLAPDVRNFDPRLALLGGADGLEPYRSISSRAASHLSPEGHVLVEVGAGQAEDVTEIFAARGFRPAGRYRDLGGHERCLSFQLRTA